MENAMGVVLELSAARGKGQYKDNAQRDESKFYLYSGAFPSIILSSHAKWFQ